MSRRRRSALGLARRVFDQTGSVLDELGLPDADGRAPGPKGGRLVDVPVTSKRRWRERLWPFREPEPHWRDYEKAAAAFLTGLGYSGVRAAAAGPDGGVDVRVAGMLVGQVKAQESKVGSPAAPTALWDREPGGRGRRVFSKSGYSKSATRWANSVEMPLFEVSYGGDGFAVDGANGPAKRFVTVRF